MSGSWGLDKEKSKADLVALYLNKAINEIINICQKTEPEPRHYFDICIIGYGQDGEVAQILWEGAMQDQVFVSPSMLKQNPTGNMGEIEIERRTFKGNTLVKIPVNFWFSPIAQSLTPMGLKPNNGFL